MKEGILVQTHIDNVVFFNEDLAFTFLGSLLLFFHILMILLDIRIDELSMELVCWQVLQKELCFEWKVFKIMGKILDVTNVFGKFKRNVNWRKLKNEKLKKKGAYYNYSIRGYLQKNAIWKTRLKEQIQRLFKCGYKKQNKTSYDCFFISIVCKHTWFINYWGSQHLNFQIFSTFENFALDQKYILETISSLMCVGKALLPSSFQMGFPIALEMYYIFQSWQINYHQLVSY